LFSEGVAGEGDTYRVLRVGVKKGRKEKKGKKST
jgi:hypothetical protein